MIENKDMQEAIDRIARTPDGLLLYRLLQKILCGTVAAQTDQCALQFAEGRRILARDLMAYMADGVAENDRAACITFSLAKPAATGASRGAGRRVTANTYVAGYDNPDDAGPIFSPGSNTTGGNGAT
jgi:hypothetical protein